MIPISVSFIIKQSRHCPVCGYSENVPDEWCICANTNWFERWSKIYQFVNSAFEKVIVRETKFNVLGQHLYQTETIEIYKPVLYPGTIPPFRAHDK